LAASALGVEGAGSALAAGGSAIPVTSAPWQVWVQMGNASGDYYCGGAILDALHVVTAAHCLRDNTGAAFSAAQVSVTAGISAFDPVRWLATPLAGDVEQDGHVTAIRVHPGYVWSATPTTDSAQADDIAVLELSTALNLSGPAASAVPLVATGQRPAAGMSVTATGFGAQNAAANVGDGHLHGVSQSVEDSAIASDASNAVWLVASGPAGICQGDSGGPVVAGSPAQLVGVISHAASCDPNVDSFAVDV